MSDMNCWDLTSANPAMRFFDAALADLGLTRDDIYDPSRPLPNTRIASIGSNPTLDRVMEKAHELHAAAS